jgi:hypothetical protein
MVRSTYVDACVDADHHRQLFRRAERSWRRRSNRVKCPTSGRICSREAAAAASLRFDRSVSFRHVQPVQQQENMYPHLTPTSTAPTIFCVDKCPKSREVGHLTEVEHRRRQRRSARLNNFLPST